MQWWQRSSSVSLPERHLLCAPICSKRPSVKMAEPSSKIRWLVPLAAMLIIMELLLMQFADLAV